MIFTLLFFNFYAHMNYDIIYQINTIYYDGIYYYTIHLKLWKFIGYIIKSIVCYIKEMCKM
jgi:GT2 family glycosyltransferase